MLDAAAATKKRLFEQVAQLFETHTGIPQATVFDSLSARERLSRKR